MIDYLLGPGSRDRNNGTRAATEAAGKPVGSGRMKRYLELWQLTKAFDGPGGPVTVVRDFDLTPRTRASSSA